MTDQRDLQLRSLEEMYIIDTKKLREEIEQLRKERDQWKERCLGAEVDKANISRQLRHV